MKKIQKILIIFIIMLQMIIINLPIYAAVGDFETYDSGSSWSGSSSSSSYDSSWSSSYDSYYNRDYGSDYSSGDNRNSSKTQKSKSYFIFEVIVFIIFIIIIYFDTKNKFNKANSRLHPRTQPNIQQNIEAEEQDIVNKIRYKDINFNKEEFLSWVRDLYVKLQYAWSDRDWEKIRCFETDQLYEQHSSQIQNYINNHQINKMENVSVNTAKLNSFRQEGDKDILDVVVNVKQIDYVVDEETGRIIKGDKEYKFRNYKLTFIRKTGVKTKPGEIEVNTKECPNCGAPTQITSSGKCEYCGSIITTGEFNWVLANLEPYNGI